MGFNNIFTRFQNRCRRSLSELCSRRTIELKLSRPIVSFTFDDFPHSALANGGEILRKYNLKGTYYVSLGLMDTDIPAGRAFSEGDLVQAQADGHELGCHTFAHCHAWDTDPGLFERSILENREALGRLLPDASFHTHSYPIAWPRPRTKELVGKRFDGCRGGGQAVNTGRADRNLLKSFFLEKCGERIEPVKVIIEENRRACGWLIFSTHDIGSQPTVYGCSPSFFEAVVRLAIASDARILTVAEALKLTQDANG